MFALHTFSYTFFTELTKWKEFCHGDGMFNFRTDITSWGGINLMFVSQACSNTFIALMFALHAFRYTFFTELTRWKELLSRRWAKLGSCPRSQAARRSIIGRTDPAVGSSMRSSRHGMLNFGTDKTSIHAWKGGLNLRRE